MLVQNVLFPLLICFGLSIAEIAEKNTYTTKYDNIDINDVIHNERLLKNYVFCLLEKGPCTPDGLELKKNMPDAIETDCSKCSEKQRQGSEIMMRFLIDNKPEYWNPLQDKYDPTGTYKQRYLDSKKIEVSAEPVEPTEV
ncbi:ejaculatory bulb-specific protein 3-like isoform X2 [Anthonomus grandis grandis]|uniref:ejaculatory bulb-specific protein 3-like isoform X2 n=1 Tax=Anthonomus grandis grandis TaxID=2921223 RepID=UPI002165C38D|nr:ejaculatory bulb-specific protein 3-like isoform X2 [Anthonomus grandis grandis]